MTLPRQNSAWVDGDGRPTRDLYNWARSLSAPVSSSSDAMSYALGDLSNVLISGLSDGNVLTWSNSIGRWINAAPSGGSDPWTYVKLASDFSTGSATAVDVTGLSFTPAANTTYEIEGCFLLRTATATVGPRPGVAWPTGCTDGVAYLQTTSAAGTVVMQNGNINAAVLGPVGGLPNTTQSWPAQMQVTMIVGASPSGTFKIQLATETDATNVTMKAGSWIKYRTM